jgi:hypothetical protein
MHYAGKSFGSFQAISLWCELTNWLAGLTRFRTTNGRILIQRQSERFCREEWTWQAFVAYAFAVSEHAVSDIGENSHQPVSFPEIL